ncbi:MAG: ABC transporter substrate-binding protein [Oligoflexia bacterium]|nr:ABC transporter substrate-binding protein [Oligoflexia bacterium]
MSLLNVSKVTLKFISSLYLLCTLLLLLLFTFSLSAEEKQSIKLGLLVDLSGPTSEISMPYADGVREYANYLNENGGIKGRKVEIETFDYRYEIPKALTAFEKFYATPSILAIIGWGTGDSMRIAPVTKEKKILFIPGSFAESLVTPPFPYVFVPSSTYDEEVGVLLKYIKDNHKKSSGKPRLAILHHDSGFGRAPIEYAKKVCEKLGIEIVSINSMDSGITNATDIFKNIAPLNPQYVILHDTARRTSVGIRDGKTVLPNAQFLGTYYSISEQTFEIAGNKTDGYIAISPYRGWNSDAKEIKFIKDYLKKKYSKSEPKPIHYIQGWAVCKLLTSVIANSGNNPSRETLQNNFEKLSNFDLNGLTSPISFSPSMHKGARKLMLLRANFSTKNFDEIGPWMDIPEL